MQFTLPVRALITQRWRTYIGFDPKLIDLIVKAAKILNPSGKLRFDFGETNQHAAEVSFIGSDVNCKFLIIPVRL